MTEKTLPPAYTNLNQRANKYGESNDCTVVAVALATGCSYEEAHNAMAQQGRIFRKGAYGTRRAIKTFGYIVTKISDFPNRRDRPMIKDLDLPKSGDYLVYTSDHVLVCKGGLVTDWTNGRRHRVISIHKIQVSGAPTQSYPKVIPQHNLRSPNKNARKPETKFRWVVWFENKAGEVEVTKAYFRKPQITSEHYIRGRKAETAGKLQVTPLAEAIDPMYNGPLCNELFENYMNVLDNMDANFYG